MNIDEIKVAKVELEYQIRQLIREYESLTRTYVEAVQLGKAENLAGETTTYRVDVDVRL